MSAGAPEPMRAHHLPAVLALAAQVPTAPHWPAWEYMRMLDVIAAEPTRRGAWVLLAGDATLLGFALATQVAGNAELEAVVMAPAHRRRGHGRQLVHAVAAWAGALGAATLALELRASNHAALALYQQLGFRHDGVRPRYYRNPEEDALLMSLPLL